MRTGISLAVTPEDRRRLEAIVADRNAPQKHVWRCRIVLLTADGVGTNGIMRQAGVAKTAVWRWQERFVQEEVEGLLHDKTRPSRIPPLGLEIAAEVVRLTLDDPPGETTHGTADAMAGGLREDPRGRPAVDAGRGEAKVHFGAMSPSGPLSDF